MKNNFLFLILLFFISCSGDEQNDEQELIDSFMDFSIDQLFVDYQDTDIYFHDIFSGVIDEELVEFDLYVKLDDHLEPIRIPKSYVDLTVGNVIELTERYDLLRHASMTVKVDTIINNVHHQLDYIHYYDINDGVVFDKYSGEYQILNGRDSYSDLLDYWIPYEMPDRFFVNDKLYLFAPSGNLLQFDFSNSQLPTPQEVGVNVDVDDGFQNLWISPNGSVIYFTGNRFNPEAMRLKIYDSEQNQTWEGTYNADFIQIPFWSPDNRAYFAQSNDFNDGYSIYEIYLQNNIGIQFADEYECFILQEACPGQFNNILTNNVVLHGSLLFNTSTNTVFDDVRNFRDDYIARTRRVIADGLYIETLVKGIASGAIARQLAFVTVDSQGEYNRQEFMGYHDWRDYVSKVRSKASFLTLSETNQLVEYTYSNGTINSKTYGLIQFESIPAFSMK